MRFLLIFILALIGTEARSATIWIANTNWNSTQLTNRIRLQPAGPILSDGTWLITGPFQWYSSTNGLFTNVLSKGNYQLDIQGVTVNVPANTVPKDPILFAVPDGTNTYKLPSLLISGANTYNYTPGVAALTSTNNTVTITQTDGGNVDLEVAAGSGGSATTNAADLTTGTLADARLSANVPRLSATQAWTGTNTFQLVAGNGGGLTNVLEDDTPSRIYNLIKDFGGVGDLATDDSAPFQKAIDFANTNQLFIGVKVPAGNYRIARAFQSIPNVGSPALAQIIIPVRDYSTNRTVGVKFIGLSDPTENMNWTTNNQPLGTNGAFIISTNTPSSYPACVFGLPTQPNASYGICSFRLQFEKITFRGKDNPTVPPLDFLFLGEGRAKDCVIDTGVMLSQITDPTNLNVFGIRMPGVNNWTTANLENVNVSGYYRGFCFGEHVKAVDCKVWRCPIGAQLNAAFFENELQISCVACRTNLEVTGSTKYILKLSTEHVTTGANGMPNNTVLAADINDPNGYLRGDLFFSGVNTGGTEANFINPTPGSQTNFNYHSVYQPGVVMRPNRSTSFSQFAIGGDIASDNATLPSLTFYSANTFGGPFGLLSFPSMMFGSQTNPQVNFARIGPAGISNFVGAYYGSGAGLTSITASNAFDTTTGPLPTGILTAGTTNGAGHLLVVNANGKLYNTFDGSALTNLNATELRSGTVAPAILGSGTANNTTFLRGDSTWATPAGGGGTQVYSNQTITIAGTANQITSSAGAQDLTVNRTWTLSLPNPLIAPGIFSASGITNTGLTASRMVLTDANKAESSAAGSGANIVRADGTLATFTDVSALAPGPILTNLSTLEWTNSGRTIVANAPVLDLSQTWNNSGVTFTAARVNAVSTASSGTSLLLDLQLAGVSKLKVDKNGNLVFASGAGTQISGNSVDIGYNRAAINLRSSWNILWSSTGLADGTSDLGLARNAAGSLEINNGTAGTFTGTFFMWGGESTLTSDQTSTSASLASTTLSVTLAASKTYTFQAELYLSDSTSIDGAVIDFGGGSATATTFIAMVTAFDTALNLSSRISTLTTTASASTFSGAGAFEVHGTIFVNAGGTFIPRFAQANHTTGTLTLAKGSFIRFFQSP